MSAISTWEALDKRVDRERLLDTATRLVAVPSRTGEAKGVLDELAEILRGDGFVVERPDGGYPEAPAVAARFDSGKPGRVLQFNGHVDTVHLPFVPPAVVGGNLTGSGSADMKAGTAAAVEALRAIRDANALKGGSVLFTAHDLHEAPWGDGRQLDTMIRQGYVGDAVLLPEPLHGHLPAAGRGSACWKLNIRRSGQPVHEVMRPLDEPNVVAAGAEAVSRLMKLNERISRESHPIAGAASAFVGQIHSGEIFNQYPQECMLEGTRRWLPGTSRAEVEREFRELVAQLGADTETTIALRYQVIRDAYYLEQADPFVELFLDTYREFAGESLPVGAKPFCDDGNSFWAIANVPAITHGPKAGGQHTVNEWVSIDDLVRVARLYARTAAAYCG